MNDREAFSFQVLGHKNGLQRIVFFFFVLVVSGIGIWTQDLSFMSLTARSTNAPLTDFVKFVSNLNL